MPKTKKSVKSVSKSSKSAKVVAKKRVSPVVVKAPHMTKTIFGAFYLLVLAVLSLVLILISSQLSR